MNYRTFHIVQSAIYLLVIVVLCFMIPRPYNKLDSTFQATFEREQKNSESEIATYISKINENLDRPGNEERLQPNADKLARGERLTSEVTSLLYDKRRTHASTDSLQTVVENYMTEMLSILNSYDTFGFRKYLEEKMTGFYLQKDKNGKWLYNLLKGQSPERRVMLFSLLRSRIYMVRNIVVQRLMDLSYNRSDCMSMVLGHTISNTRYFNTCDSINAWISLLTIVRPPRIEFYTGYKLLHTLNDLAPYSCIAGDVGDYKVYGYLRHLVNSHGKWDTIPWSFQYRVVGQGICLVQNANQVCYRHVPNPISVSIPGYPADKIKLQANGAKLINNNNGKWTITVADEACKTIIAYADATDSRGHTSTVHAVKFAVHDLPQPLLTIDGEEATILSTDKLNSVHTLGAKYADDDWPNYTITRYEICMISAAGKHLGTFTVNGNQLGNGTIATEAWSQLSAGARIYLTDIIARTSEGAVLSPKATGLLVM